MTDTRTMSNPILATMIGVHATHASRIRNGRRVPGLDIMVNIRTQFGWSIDEQVDAVQDGTFPEKFEQVLAKWEAR